MVILGLRLVQLHPAQRRLLARLHVGGDHRRAVGQPLPAPRDLVPLRTAAHARRPRAGARGLRDLPARVRADDVLRRRRPAQPAADRGRRRAHRPACAASAPRSTLTLFVLVMIRSARHYRRADSFERLQLTPVYTFALLTFALVTFAQVGDRRPGVVRGLRLQRADAIRLHRRADPQPALPPRRGAAREHGGAARLAGAAGPGRRRRPAQAGARPARRRAVAARGPGADAARGAQPRGRGSGPGGACSTRPRTSCRRASPSCASWRAESIRPC